MSEDRDLTLRETLEVALAMADATKAMADRDRLKAENETLRRMIGKVPQGQLDRIMHAVAEEEREEAWEREHGRRSD